jgi:hypothetical protein
MLSRTRLICIVCLCPILSISAAEAEPAPAQTDAVQAGGLGGLIRLPKSGPQTFDIDFPGGELMVLIEIIKGQNDGIVPNVIISDEVGGTEIPPFQLANVEFHELMEALDSIDIGLDIDMLTDNVSTITNKLSKSPQLVEIYSIRRLLDPNGPLLLKMDDIATAIRTAWEMIQYAGDPSMKVHQETGLLIVRGTEEEQEVVRTVISRLSDQLQEAEGALWRRSQEQIKQMKAEHAQKLEQMSAAHAQELNNRQRLFELELRRHQEDYLSLKVRHEKLLAEYEALKREN